MAVGGIPSAVRDARGGLNRAERVGDRPLLAAALAGTGFMETWALEITPGLLERGVEIERSLDRPLMFHESPTFILAMRWAYADDAIDEARDSFERIAEAARG